MRRVRQLFPWELHCGCPTCHVRPRERCVTMDTRYPPGYTFRDGTTLPGAPTTAHLARYRLWAYLFGCTKKGPLPEARPLPSGPDGPDD